MNPINSTERWHVRGIRLPYGEQLEEFWVADGIQHDAPIPGARDLPGGWFLPGGLVDTHVHLTMDFNGAKLPDGSPALIRANLAAQRAAGVLAVRDIGERPETQITLPRADGPHLVRSGRILVPPGRFHPGVGTETTADQLIAAGLAQIASGAQWVKVIADFPGPDGNWFRPIVNYSPEILRALVEAVHAAGARVAAHVSGPFVADVVRAGVDSVEHGPLIDHDLLAEMVARGTAWTPTLTTVIGALESILATDAPIGGYIREVIAQLKQVIPQAVALGIPVMAGTDESPHGTIALEIARLRSFGLSACDALAAASSIPRAYLGIAPVASGQPVDLVTFSADPRVVPDVLAQPTSILFGGRLIQT